MPPIVTTSSRSKAGKQSSLLSSRPFLIVLAVIAVAVVSVLLLRNGRPNTQSQSPKVPDTTAKSSNRAVRPDVAAPSDTIPEEPADETVETRDGTSDEPKGNGQVDERQEGQTTPANEETEPPSPPQPKHFNGVAEQLIALAMSADEEHGMPPLPIPPEKQVSVSFLIAITNDIVIYEDDPPKLVELKERVADAKNQIKTILDNGGTVTDALKEYQNYVNEGNKIRNEVMAEYQRLRSEASEKEAEEYLAMANKELEAEGIKRIKGLEERRREREERMREREARKAQEAN